MPMPWTHMMDASGWAHGHFQAVCIWTVHTIEEFILGCLRKQPKMHLPADMAAMHVTFICPNMSDAISKVAWAYQDDSAILQNGPKKGFHIPNIWEKPVYSGGSSMVPLSNSSRLLHKPA
eukprot:jgi/Botrbrau1/5430/Bobra.182_1s0032.1